MIYVASRVRHAHIWKALRSQGHNIISTWIDEAGPDETSSMAELWQRCISETVRADVLVLLVFPGETLKGALVEVGAALASGISVHVVGTIDGSWSNHPLVTTFETLDAAMAAAGEL